MNLLSAPTKYILEYRRERVLPQLHDLVSFCIPSPWDRDLHKETHNTVSTTKETQGKCQSVGQSFTGCLTPVGVAGPLFPPRRLSLCICVHFWDILSENELGGNYSFTPKNPTKFPANPKSCRLYG